MFTRNKKYQAYLLTNLPTYLLTYLLAYFTYLLTYKVYAAVWSYWQLNILSFACTCNVNRGYVILFFESNIWSVHYLSIVT